MAFLLTQLAEYTISFERLSFVIIGPLSDTYLTPFHWSSGGQSSSGRTVGYCSDQSACRYRERRGTEGGDLQPDEWTCTAIPVNAIYHQYIFPHYTDLYIYINFTYCFFLNVNECLKFYFGTHFSFTSIIWSCKWYGFGIFSCMRKNSIHIQSFLNFFCHYNENVHVCINRGCIPSPRIWNVWDLHVPVFEGVGRCRSSRGPRSCPVDTSTPLTAVVPRGQSCTNLQSVIHQS